ncbi:hypothetical protein J5N97_002658 [Dioscorea zingiberensis]|uniref:Lysosomal Pro-X carboxypeptidase n=1 Tax=Dioscorea zingiberensis TaxID=325984 RepID=A0A9D5HQL1_9LILI|nr:hypothetical protein J5N97_002658 [Dioscorea zingiberensis]
MMTSSSSLHLIFILFTIFTVITTTTTTVKSLPIPFATTPQQSLLQKHTNKHLKPSSTLPFTTHYFPQLLDHFTFTPNSSKIFYQKYLLNSTFFSSSSSSPIFVYTGNEGNIEWFASNSGFIFDIAPKFNALLLFIEHRFYGDSLPFGNDSYSSAETLGYLTSTQALADYAQLIRSLKHNLSAEASPVIVFGGSYGGMLAAWFRLKYPHVAIGALASSAPILQFDDIVPWSSFYDGVSQDYKDESMNCFEVIKGSWDELLALSLKKNGLQKIGKIFRSCKKLQSVEPVKHWLWTAFASTAMVDYPTPANFMADLPAYPVKEMCRAIDGFPARVSKLPKVFAAASIYYNYSGTEKCFDFESGSNPHGLHGWAWQACTEMVMPLTCSNESMFPPSGYDYKNASAGCEFKYGVQSRPHWITTEYGGYRIGEVLKRFGSNIIFSNGLRDPWSRGGVIKNISPSIVALVTKKGAHHLDFRSGTKNDPKWLIEQRRKEVEIMQGWIRQYHEDMKD